MAAADKAAAGNEMLVMDKVKPSGSSIFRSVESFGSVVPFSVRAMQG